MNEERAAIAVVIPSYRCRDHILKVIERIGPEVEHIFVVDDKCPEQTGEFVRQNCIDPRTKVIFHQENQGVGGAMITGYKAALAANASIAIKIDGDGQMDPMLIPTFIQPILQKRADYTKGNRFHDIEGVRIMPPIRLFGNAVLSFMNKLSSGYWDVFDPTNGYTAIHRAVLQELPLHKISRRYFFESDMLFRLYLSRAVVHDIPMMSVYGDEKSSLKISKIIPEFLARHSRNTFKRVFYTYFLRNFSLASIELILGISLLTFGLGFGLHAWLESSSTGVRAGAGTVMLAALPLLVGVQLLLGFLNLDMTSVPKSPRALDWRSE